jgi:hypothetical protein
MKTKQNQGAVAMTKQREYMCQYGNCESYKTPIVVTLNISAGIGERLHFCSPAHAALWLLRRVPRHARLESLSEQLSLSDLDTLREFFP